MLLLCRKYAWLALVALIFAPSSFAAPRIAVVDFENKSQYGGWRVGRGAADMLTTELVRGSGFDVYERERLNSIMQEQNLGSSGRVDPSTAAKIGKILGVQYIVTGAVTEYGQSTSGGGGGGVNIGKKGYYSSVDVRIVDVNSSRIIFAETGSGSESSLNVRVFGIGGGESFNEKHATQTLRDAIGEVVAKLKKADLASAGGSGSAGGAAASAADSSVLLADVDGSAVILNAGSGAGLKSGQVLNVKRKARDIKDPATGAVIKTIYDTLGKIKLTNVQDSYSEGTITEGSGFKVGDSAEP
ncbi:MAG TPA: CsgG/HfaB family protein [Cellvibrionaceae bacterium]